MSPAPLSSQWVIRSQSQSSRLHSKPLTQRAAATAPELILDKHAKKISMEEGLYGS